MVPKVVIALAVIPVMFIISFRFNIISGAKLEILIKDMSAWVSTKNVHDWFVSVQFTFIKSE